MKNSADQGGFYHTLGDLQNSSLPTKAEFNIEDILRWREDTNFMFEWHEQYLTSERSSLVRYCSCHENIKIMSSS